MGQKEEKRVYIDLCVGGASHTVLVIGYTKDGGFFMSNVRHDGGDHIIFELVVPLREWSKAGMHWVRRKNRVFITTHIPKLIHHLDGRAQVSGSGITSGFYKFFKRGKGVYTDSYDLIAVNNDGGPTMGSLVWGLDHFGHKPEANNILFDESIVFVCPIGTRKGNPVAYAFEAYYIPKTSEIDFLFPADEVALLNHPAYGAIPGKVIPCPDHTPGRVILTCCQTTIGEGFMDHPYGHQISGAASFITGKGCKNIFIQYPHTVFPAKLVSKANSLDFGKKEKMKSSIDDFFHRLFNRVEDINKNSE